MRTFTRLWVECLSEKPQQDHMGHLANGMKIKTPPNHKRMKYLAQCVCVCVCCVGQSVSQSVSRCPWANLCCCCCCSDRRLVSFAGIEQELHSSPSRYCKVRPAMYRSASLLDSQEVMALYGGHRERYCLKDDGSISEVRAASKCSKRTDAHDHDFLLQTFVHVQYLPTCIVCFTVEINCAVSCYLNLYP